MPWARCRNCGCFREPVRDADLFDAPLPMPAVDDAFAAFHRQSQMRERAAAARGADRQVGRERRARRDFTLAALRGQPTGA
ncbi:MAG: hypothetical protein DI624_04090 [Brevundimonas sp.]|nr:MAG: hypothetical protein DI624_04090 [Brevundimonas sp.]